MCDLVEVKNDFSKCCRPTGLPEQQGATFIGYTSTEGHKHKKSQAIRDGMFCGLAIDEDCQRDMTENRLNSWIEEIRSSWSET